MSGQVEAMPDPAQPRLARLAPAPGPSGPRPAAGAAPFTQPPATPRLLPLPPVPAEPRWSAAVPCAIGALSLVALVGGFGVWSVGATLAGAVVAPGVVQVEANRQVVQHPDGGVVGEIRVKDGDAVRAGDILLRLDGSKTRSELAIVEAQLRELGARRARLEAERDAHDTIRFDDPSLSWALGDPEFSAQIESERTLFHARLEALAQESDLLREQNAQIGNRVRGVAAQLDAVTEQAGLMRKALADQQALLKQKLTQSSRVLELGRDTANLRGQVGQLTAQIAELRGQSASNDISLLQLVTKRREEAVTQLRDIQYKQVELAEQRLALKDTLSRLDVRAPMDGIIYNTRVFAVNSVVQRAEPLMYIIPQGQPLVVAARVDGTHIDDVHLGQDVSLKFPAFDQRETPAISGTLTRISADALTDEATRQSYFAVTVAPEADVTARLGKHALVPGMPVEAYIRTSDRSPMAYLMHPFMVYFDRAFRE